MVAVRLKGTLTEDRRLVVKIPDDIPAGEVYLIIEVEKPSAEPNELTAKARGVFASANFLSTTWDNLIADGPIGNDDDELFELPPGQTLDQMVDEERAER